LAECRLQSSAYTEWKAQYINYDALKRLLKERTDSHLWSASDENDFTNALEGELEKIHAFQRGKVRTFSLYKLEPPIHSIPLKVAELSKRINDAETAVKRVVADYEEEDDDEFPTAHNNHDPEAAVPSDVISAADDAGSDDDDDDDETASLHGLEEEFRRLEEEVATLVADVHDLALYTKVSPANAVQASLTSCPQLNFTGFMKIVKVHLLVTVWMTLINGIILFRNTMYVRCRSQS
jgi:SPX domain protein involved in polyphosphate accumulation